MRNFVSPYALRYTLPMRAMRRLLLFILIVALGVAVFLFFRRDTRAAFGPEVALCPGPDLYGYTCESGTGFAYIDATNDTRLYQDDGVITLELPFPFVFYGTTYTAVQASSNGNLQFGSANPSPENACLDGGPVAGMGDMIAPFWMDLDLRFSGFLETTVVGEAPERIFVVEWDDVPRRDDDGDRVTFQVQLFEGTHDILFLYEDVTLFAGNNGSAATIGLQSALQGLALQYSCNQPAVADAGRIRFPHPAAANADLGLETVLAPVPVEASPVARGEVATLVTWLNTRGPAALTSLRTHWLSQRPFRRAAWQWVDLTGNGRSDLLLLWRGPADHPQLTQLVVVAQGDDGRYTLALEHAFSTRETAVSAVDLVQTVDLTGDDVPDAVLHAADTNATVVVTGAMGNMALVDVAPSCGGSVTVVDTDGNGRVEIVRDGCAQPGRVSVEWNGREFTPVSQE